jgi:hypothetical protein
MSKQKFEEIVNSNANQSQDGNGKHICPERHRFKKSL